MISTGTMTALASWIASARHPSHLFQMLPLPERTTCTSGATTVGGFCHGLDLPKDALALRRRSGAVVGTPRVAGQLLALIRELLVLYLGNVFGLFHPLRLL